MIEYKYRHLVSLLQIYWTNILNKSSNKGILSINLFLRSIEYLYSALKRTDSGLNDAYGLSKVFDILLYWV